MAEKGNNMKRVNCNGVGDMSFSDYLKNLRTKQGLKLREVERLTKISNSYLSQIETGKRNPPHPDILKKLAPIYEVSLKELMEKAGYLEIEDEISDYIHREPTFKGFIEFLRKKKWQGKKSN